MTKNFERKQAERYGSEIPYTHPSRDHAIYNWQARRNRPGRTQFDQLPQDRSVLLNDSLLGDDESIQDTVLPWIDQQGFKLRRYERVLEGEQDRIAFTFKSKKAAILFKLTWG